MFSLCLLKWLCGFQDFFCLYSVLHWFAYGEPSLLTQDESYLVVECHLFSCCWIRFLLIFFVESFVCSFRNLNCILFFSSSKSFLAVVWLFAFEFFLVMAVRVYSPVACEVFIRDQTRVICTGRWILYPEDTGSPVISFLMVSLSGFCYQGDGTFF